MRLIDADEIIKWADDSVSQYGGTYSTDMLNMFGLFKHIIDNAPTVENSFQDGYKCGYSDGNLAGYTQCLNEKKSQGEWIAKTKGWTSNTYACSVCGRLINCTRSELELFPFCHCGAEMVGGSEVKSKND